MNDIAFGERRVPSHGGSTEFFFTKLLLTFDELFSSYTSLSPQKIVFPRIETDGLSWVLFDEFGDESSTGFIGRKKFLSRRTPPV